MYLAFAGILIILQYKQALLKRVLAVHEVVGMPENKSDTNKSFYRTNYGSGHPAGSRKLEAVKFETEETTINY